MPFAYVMDWRKGTRNKVDKRLDLHPRQLATVAYTPSFYSLLNFWPQSFICPYIWMAHLYFKCTSRRGYSLECGCEKRIILCFNNNTQYGLLCARTWQGSLFNVTQHNKPLRSHININRDQLVTKTQRLTSCTTTFTAYMWSNI